MVTDEMDANGQRTLAVEEGVVGEILSMDGDLAGALGYYRTAIQRLNRLLAADPKNAILLDDLSDQYAALGRTLVRMGKIGEGLSLLERATTLPHLNPESAATIHLWTAEALARKGDVPGTLEQAQHAASDFARGATPGGGQWNDSANRAAARITIGSALIRQRQKEQANTEFRAALAESTKLAAAGNEQAKFTVAEANYQLGLLAARQGRLSEARELYAASSNAWKSVRNPGAMSPNGWAFDGPRMVERELVGCHESCK
jgi:tetratricopeptide (TPR) repeat protein